MKVEERLSGKRKEMDVETGQRVQEGGYGRTVQYTG